MREINEEPAIFGVVDELSTRYGNTLSGEFIPGTLGNIAVRAFRPVTGNSRDDPTENALKYPVCVQILKPDFIFEDVILRSLLAESNSTFIAIQALKNNLKPNFSKISRTYRSIIRACLEKLQRSIKKIDNNEREKYEQYVCTFYSIECIWHLCEIFFLDPKKKSNVITALLDWTRFHFSNTERVATDLLLSGSKASESEDYWPVIKSLVMQGNLEVVRALLKMHPSAESPAFNAVEQIFLSMPHQNTSLGYVKHNPRSKWQYWITDTERKLAANILAADQNLEQLALIVLGDAHSWNNEISKSNCWYELLAGYLHYTMPSCTHFDLGSAVNDWLIRWGQLKGFNSNTIPLNQLDKTILHLMQNDVNQVICSIQHMGDNQWFATHLIDLLYNCGQLGFLGGRQANECTQLRNSLLIEFGTNLMSYSSLWQLGISYLESCSVEGQFALELLLPRLPVRTEKMAQKIITIARKNKNLTIEQDICKVQAKRFFNDCCYGSALQWAIRSKDQICVTSIADFLLKHYSKTGDMLCPDVIANIGAKMFISTRLVFLVKYFDFYQFYRKRDFLPAAELLVNLLESKITPEYFWPSLLIDSIPLLESKDPKIMSKETCTIIQHLQTELIPLIEKTKIIAKQQIQQSDLIFKDYRIENIEEIINLLRLACARNLSRAIIIENTIQKTPVS